MSLSETLYPYLSREESYDEPDGLQVWALGASWRPFSCNDSGDIDDSDDIDDYGTPYFLGWELPCGEEARRATTFTAPPHALLAVNRLTVTLAFYDSYDEDGNIVEVTPTEKLYQKNKLKDLLSDVIAKRIEALVPKLGLAAFHRLSDDAQQGLRDAYRQTEWVLPSGLGHRWMHSIREHPLVPIAIAEKPIAECPSTTRTKNTNNKTKIKKATRRRTTTRAKRRSAARTKPAQTSRKVTQQL